MKHLRHKVQVNIADCKGGKERVLSGTSLRLPQRLLRLLFGEFSDILVLTPGRTVECIEIREIKRKDSMKSDTDS